jgi:hypothetical protein
MKTKLLLSSAVLKLNACWQAMEYITVKDAFLKMFGEAEALRPLEVALNQDGSLSNLTQVHSPQNWLELAVDGNHDWLGLSHGRRVRIPLVVITPHYTKLPKVTLQLNKRGLYIRDRGHCCYCGTLLTLDQATNDHIVPTSRGGKNTWFNCVLSCGPCNFKKGDRTPEEAGMRLLKQPQEPAPMPPMPAIRPDSPKEHLALLRAA